MKKAFTLIEMVIVIVMLGILAAIFVPSQEAYVGAARNVQVESVRTNFERNLKFQQNLFLGDPSKDIYVKNDFEYTVSGSKFEFTGTIPTIDTIGNSDNSSQSSLDSDTNCAELLKILGNLSADKIQDAAWVVTYTAPSSCTFNFAPTNTQFTYDNSDGTVSLVGAA